MKNKLNLPAITKDFNDLKSKLSGNVKKENPAIREVITKFNIKLDIQLKSFIEENKDYL